MQKLEEKLLPIAETLGNQRHLLAIRDGFTTIMPLMIIGALMVALNNLPIEGFQNFMKSIFKFQLEDGSHICMIVIYIPFLIVQNKADAKEDII